MKAARADLTDFEKKVVRGLERCGVLAETVTETQPLGVAVSGGADSVSLLCALTAIFGAKKLRALTVNHNLRAESETAGDAQFVTDLCARLCVPCTRIDFARGEVVQTAETRGRGTEEAARFLRYRAFSDFCAVEQVCALCLAHHQNDMLETLLMRFLQGSGAEGGYGMARRRGAMVRPLLDISRAEIEAYLRARGQDWRTDATNADTRYLRNNIRKNLLPVLDAHMAGWKTALVSGAEKAADDNEALQACADKAVWTRDGDAVWLGAGDFFSAPRAVRRRMLFNACNLLGGAERFPYHLVQPLLCADGADDFSGTKPVVSAHGICISVNSEKIIVKKGENKATESGFTAILEENGRVLLRRSAQSGDVIRAKDGTLKSVQKIFGDWKVRAQDRQRISVVQDVSQPGQPIVALLGAEWGYADWIVR